MAATTPTDDPQEAFVRITLKDVYAEVRALREEMSTVMPAIPDHEKRLRSVEAWKYTLPPTFILALVAAVSSWHGLK
jgi:hypothetical protein